eukprot:9211591-Lingulodinium_polyedra.AAC.1
MDRRLVDALLEQGVRCEQGGKLCHPWLFSLSESSHRVGANQFPWHGHGHFTLQLRGTTFVVLCPGTALNERGYSLS